MARRGRKIAVLDAADPAGRSLEEAVAQAGFRPERAHSLADLQRSLGEAKIAVVSFEALWPNPQNTVKALRAATPGSRLVVAHAEDSPRLRLGQRLWSAGEFDFFLPRTVSVRELTYVLQQAVVDAQRQEQAASGTQVGLASQLEFLEGLSAAFAHQRSVAGLLRELHLRLPTLVPYLALQVYVTEPEGLRASLFQTRPLPHDAVFGLTEKSCEALSLASGQRLHPEAITFETPAPVTKPEANEPLGELRHQILPLQLPHGLLGCLSLLLPREVDPSVQALLRLISYQFVTALSQAQMLETAERASLIDELTGCHNRRYLNQLLASEWKRTRRYSQPLSIAMVDVDHFKRLNDVYGHVVGDAVLRQIARFLKAQLRETDHLIRYGGEEFAVVMPETGPAEAGVVMERIRLLASSGTMDAGAVSLHVTFSAGIAGYPGSRAETAEQLIHEADDALYAAKRTGRDRICIAPGAEPARVPGNDSPELRTAPRVAAQLAVRYLELPGFEAEMSRVTTADISAGGLSIQCDDHRLGADSYALLYLEESHKPLLTRVVWTTEENGSQRAGLRFVQASELDALTRGLEPRPSARALVLTDQPSTRSAVGRVLHAARFEVSTPAKGAVLDPAALGDVQLVVVGESVLGTPRMPRGLLETLRGKVRLVLVNETADRRASLHAMVSHQLRHVVGASDAADEALFPTLRKLLLGEYFGLHKYLLRGAKTHGWSVEGAEGKAAVLEGIREVAEGVRCHPRICDLLLMAVEEMLLNALFRAPPSGQPERPVVVECGTDGRLLVVSVLDEHGTFRAQAFHEALARALRHEKRGIPEDETHASLGFKIMLEALSHVAINVDPGRRTEVIGIVDLRRSLREHRARPPTFNLFSTDS